MSATPALWAQFNFKPRKKYCQFKIEIHQHLTTVCSLKRTMYLKTSATLDQARSTENVRHVLIYLIVTWNQVTFALTYSQGCMNEWCVHK